MSRSRRVSIVGTGLATWLLATIAWGELKTDGTPEIYVHLPGGTAGLTIDGKSDELTVGKSGANLVLRAKLDCATGSRGHISCIRTGIAMRDKHMWIILEGSKYREATLSVPLGQLKFPTEHEKVELDATGQFSLHGVQRPMRFHYTAQKAGDLTQVRGRLVINLKDFNVPQPSFAGVRTGMVAEITAQFNLRGN